MLFADSLAVIAQVLEFSYRDVERAMTLYGIAGPVGNSAPAIAWLIGLKLRHPERFHALAIEANGAHDDTAHFIDKIRGTFGIPTDAPPLNVMGAAHMLASGLTRYDRPSEGDKEVVREMIGNRLDVASAFRQWTKLLSAHVS
jgi:hypothetical protein